MKEQFFKWEEFAQEHNGIDFPVEAIQEVFLMDVEENRVWLSKKLSQLLYFEKQEIRTEISTEELENFFLEGGRNIFRQDIQRLCRGKAERVNCHVAVIREETCLSAVCYVFKLEIKKYLLGFLSIDYAPIQEYEQELETVIRRMQHIQNVNELVLEGAADYIYQLDVVNNVCTFSSKAMDVLPIEAPTVSNAMSLMLEMVIPEDRQLYLDSMTAFLTGQSDCHRAKYRIRTRQGNIMWILSQGKGLRDEDGKPMMLAGSMVDITTEQKKEEEINRMLYYDELTGLKNRRCFDTEMEEHLHKRGVQGSIVYINIHKFKLFNEMFGRSFANKILEHFSRLLELYFPGALGIYRFGGDEFLVHLQESDRNRILSRVAPFQSDLKAPREMDGHTLYINMYAAVVTYPEHGQCAEELVLHANQCLYRMSREESEGVTFFAGQEGEDVSKQYLLENELRKDINDNFKHFRVVYQPIVRLENGVSHWMGAEALLRYSNPELPNVGQMEMIKTLEYSGLILPVGRWVLSQAIKECARWNKAGRQVVVHVNMAAQQVTDAGLVEYIKGQCVANGLPPCSLVVELTETSLVNNFAVATELCHSLMALGIGVALDDFGTGYSGFTYLKNLPISQIKVDREYARDISSNQYNQVIVSFLHNLSENMHVELCVEGVETKEELDVLTNIGVSTIQGFYFERPMEAESVSKEFIRQAMGEED